MDTAAPGDGKAVTVYAATNRARQPAREIAFTSAKAETVSYARFTVAIPPNHRPGRIEWPQGAAEPNPRTSFAVTEQALLSPEAFAADVAAQARAEAPGARRVGVFVHGFNYSFPEALYRLTQMAADAPLDGAPVLFSWPSQATMSGYLADRESVTYSRDDLAFLLKALVDGAGAGEVVVVGHSLGGWLVLEAVRQLKLEKREDVLARLRVILAAPDINADVFRSQVEDIGPMKTPITVLVAQDDRALRLSRLLTADSRRVGALDVTDPAVRKAAEQHDVRLVDISSVNAQDRFKHDRYIGFARLLPHLAAQRSAALNRAGAFVLDTAGQIVSSPFRAASRVLSP